MFNIYNNTTYNYNPYTPYTTDNTGYYGYSVPTTTASNNI